MPMATLSVRRRQMTRRTAGSSDDPISNIWDYKVTGIWQKDQWEEAAKYGQKPGDRL